MITLNGYTNGFHGHISSNGCIVPKHVNWVYAQNPFRGISIFEDGWMFHPPGDLVDTDYRVGWLHEPRALRPENYERALTVCDKFDAIMTYDRYLLETRPDKFKLVPRGGMHIEREHWGLHPKSKHIAFIVSNKLWTEAHRLRREVVARYGYRLDVYGLDHYANKRDVYRDYRYAVVIENDSTDNYFTEHLLDVIAMGCIPLYRGAPNINQYLTGILQWNTLDELGALLSAATPELYGAYMSILQANYARLDDYSAAEDWAYEHIFKQWIERDGTRSAIVRALS